MSGEDDTQDPSASTRREFLVGAVGALAAGAVGCSDPMVPGVDAAAPGDSGAPGNDAASLTDGGAPPIDPPETVTEALASFPSGVAAGDATPATAVFWTLYIGAAPLQLVVWRMEGTGYGPVVHAASASVASSGYVKIDVGTLSAGAVHRYAFFELDGSGARVARSEIGTVRAALAVDALEPLRIGAVSCISQRRDIGTIGHAGGRGDLDLFLYLGDWVYTDDDADGMIPALTLDDYRGKYRLNGDRPEMRGLRRSTGQLTTWDDHEFENDLNPETQDADRRDAAVTAFFDHHPVRRDPANPERVWKSMRWGRTADIFVLDCRLERLPSTRSSPSAQYLSRAQMDWLKGALVASTARFKLIMNSVPITDCPALFDVQQVDRWEGYAAQRIEILQHVDDSAITGLLWISGDFHLASSQRVAPSGVGSTQTEILVGPAAQSGNALASTLRPPQFDFGSGTNNYTVLELDPTAGTIRAVWVKDDGTTLHEQTYALA